MREIIFRAKRVDNGEWVEGYYLENAIGKHIGGVIFERKVQIDGLEFTFVWHKVNPETVGQFTGLTDKNGMKIFEGDICRGAWGTPFEVFWDRGHTAFKARIRHELPYGQDIYYYANFDDNKISAEIIGDIHDNLELLEINK